jgi:hypothetical protein
VRLRRAEEIETLSYRTVVELNAESRLAEERVGRAERRQLQRVARGDRSDRLHPEDEEVA